MLGIFPLSPKIPLTLKLQNKMKIQKQDENPPQFRVPKECPIHSAFTLKNY